MPRFRVTWEFEGRGSSYLLEARTLEEAREAAQYRVRGIVIVSVQLDEGEGGATSAARRPRPPQPQAPAARSSFPREAS